MSQFAVRGQHQPFQNSQLTVCSLQLRNKKKRRASLRCIWFEKDSFSVFIVKRHVAQTSISPRNHHFQLTHLHSQRLFKETIKQAAPLTLITLWPSTMRTKCSTTTREDLVCAPHQMKTVFFFRKPAVSQVQVMRPYTEGALVDIGHKAYKNSCPGGQKTCAVLAARL